MKLLAATTLAAGLTLACSVSAAWKVVDNDGQIILFSSGSIKTLETDGAASIIDSATGQITLTNPQKALYTQGSADDYCTAFKEMMHKAMQALPPEQRALMQQMMQESLGNTSQPQEVEIKVQKIGAGDKIAGFETDKYQIFVKGQLQEDIWLAKDAKLQAELAQLNMEIMQKFDGCINSSMGLAQEPKVPKEYSDLLKQGWEMKSVLYQNGQQMAVNETLSLTETELSPREFSVPEGFRKIPIIEFLTSASD